MPKDCCKRMLTKMLRPEHDDEPVFVLRAQDKLAIETLGAWIAAALRDGVPMEKAKAAYDHLIDIRRWQAEHPDRVKLPD